MVSQPEQQAREAIDKLLTQAGWSVFDADQANIHAARGVAIRELPLKSGRGVAQKITYRTTGAKLKDLINEFRASPMPRVAVTVGEAERGEHPVDVRPAKRDCHGRRAPGFRAERDVRAKKVIATGTDIKAVEVVMFIRAVKSRAFFEQMEGRGVRVGVNIARNWLLAA